jgi:hypothetical protein
MQKCHWHQGWGASGGVSGFGFWFLGGVASGGVLCCVLGAPGIKSDAGGVDPLV